MAGEINPTSAVADTQTISTSNAASTATSASGTESSASVTPVGFKLVYQTFASRQDDGTYATPVYIPDTGTVAYPFTDVPVPKEIQDKEHQFNWQLGEWVAAGTDPTTVAVQRLKEVAAALSLQIATATQSIATIQEVTNTANRTLATLALTIANGQNNKEGE